MQSSCRTCRKCVEINDTKSYGVRRLKIEGSGIRMYRNASKPYFKGFDSLRPLQITLPSP